MVETKTNNQTPERVFAVGEYLEAVNIALDKFEVKITGEVTQVTLAVSGHCYFTLKDKEGKNVLDCICWKYNYSLAGVKLEVGLEVILTGKGKIYGPTGRFSFIAEVIELKGEGALKKAYEDLKNKLEREGIFAFERKRPLPIFPQKIGVITSKKGAVINDLLSNLGQFGFEVKMIDSRVEGQEAVKDLLGAIGQFKKETLDVLLIMRGGGSLESLQAFNNEALVRAIIDFPCPVLSAIGHDKDVPLLALAADFSCSTPSIAATTLNETWQMAPLTINKQTGLILETFSQALNKSKGKLVASFLEISGWLTSFFKNYRTLEAELKNYFLRIEQAIAKQKILLKMFQSDIFQGFAVIFKEAIQAVYHLSENIKAYNPKNNLALGYCLARKNGRIIKKRVDLQSGDDFDLEMADGSIQAKTI